MSNKILDLFAIILSSENGGRNKDITKLYYTLGQNPELFGKVIALFSGRTIEFPTKERIEECMTTALCYYYRMERGLDWKEIQKLVPNKIDPYNMGTKFGHINKHIQKRIDELFRKGDDK